MQRQKLDIQGHRGCRGLFPENSIPAFLNAIELGVTTLEFDAVISKDLKVIISHEPFMSTSICIAPNGEEITPFNELKHNLFQLDYKSIKLYDAGTKYFDRFPKQKKMKVYKPSLQELVLNANAKSRKVLFNIEIKRRPEWDNVYHPDFKTFADIVINEIKVLRIQSRTTVQCFDVETLQYIHNTYPEIKLVYLIENQFSFDLNMEKLQFTPFVYSPYYQLVDKDLVLSCHSNNMKLIPWTVNQAKDMHNLMKLGVDGIISDYPDLLIEVWNKHSKIPE